MESARLRVFSAHSAPRLSLYRGDLCDEAPSRSWRRQRLTASSTLRDFLREWFSPIVLRGEKDADLKTVYEYKRSVEWWADITGDPPLDDIDAFTLAEFQAGLRAATWRRGPAAPARPLAEHTIAKHLKSVRTILGRVGPTVDPRYPTAGLLSDVPYLRIRSPRRLSPGPTFALSEARAIVAAARRLSDRVERGRWLVRLSLMFFAGLRIGSTLAVTRSMVVERSGRAWLVLAGDDVKTGNALALPLHAQCLAALAVVESDGSGHVAPWALHRRTLDDHHERLQREAGIREPLGFHAWRRSHAEQLAMVGADAGELAAQAALDHSSARTTRASYVDARALMIDRLPDLFAAGEAANQLRLF